MRYLLILWLVMILTLPEELFAQNTGSDPFKDDKGNTWHQLFLDFQAEELIEMHYVNDSELIEGELSPDGYSVIFKNYHGTLPVMVRLKDLSGTVRDVTKSKCFIDPVLLHL
jgi:hypothetical protein